MNLAEVKNQKTYVLVSKHEGLVYKRVHINRSAHALTLVSDNSAYAPFEVPFTEVSELWQYYAHLSFNDEIHLQQNQIHNKLDDIQRRVIGLEHQIKA